MARRIPFRDFLAASPLFAGVDAASMEAATRAIRPRPFRRGESLLEADGAGREMYLILAGLVRVELEEDGLRAPVASVGPGHLVGALRFFDGWYPRHSFIVAADRGLAAAIPMVVYVEAARLGHPIARNIEFLAIESMIARERLSQDHYCHLELEDPPPRWQGG